MVNQFESDPYNKILIRVSTGVGDAFVVETKRSFLELDAQMSDQWRVYQAGVAASYARGNALPSLLSEACDMTDEIAYHDPREAVPEKLRLPGGGSRLIEMLMSPEGAEATIGDLMESFDRTAIRKGWLCASIRFWRCASFVILNEVINRLASAIYSRPM